MERPKVVSREYKVMLRASRFNGGERELLKAAQALWRSFSRSVAPVALGSSGELEDIKTRRLVKFLDTTKRDLNKGRYIFRERRKIDAGKREVTLKLRHPDRQVAQACSMSAKGTEGSSRTKFEEDIKAPFHSLYSYSTTVSVGNGRAFDSLKDVANLFPDIRTRLDGFESSRALAAVNHFTARELVVSGASVRIGRMPVVDAECALIVWYDHRGRPDRPVAVEFSYRYGDDHERYEGATARRAFEVFEILQSRLDKWVNPGSQTKTAFVYG